MIKRLRTAWATALLLLVAIAGSASVAAQNIESFGDGWYRRVLRVGQDYVLRNGERARDIVVVYSSATIEGQVSGDVTVVFGELRLGSTAAIDGSLFVIGGNATVQSGALVRQDLVVAGGTLDAPPSFTPGHEHVVIGTAAVTEKIRAVLPWVTEGLLLGRPIVPRLGWVWLFVAVVFVLSLALCLIFLDTVRLCAGKIAERPLSTFLVGLLVLFLTGPVSIVLAASVIGLAVVPFLLCALVVAWIVGKIGVSVRIGDSLLGLSEPDGRWQAVRSFALGFALISLIYMVPVLGLIVWALVGVTGLGAACLALMSAYRRENPLPPKVEPSPAVLTAPVSAGFGPFQYATAGPEGAAPPLDMAGSPEQTAPALPTNLALFPHATFIDRAAAFALDCILTAVIYTTLDLERYEMLPVFLLLAYHIGFWTWKGTTVGGIICQLRVVRVDGSPMRFVDALVRGLSSLFSFAVAGLGVLWILRDPERQSWHDKIAGTYVVKVPRNWPLP